jgi:ferredoxin-type protein NapG
MPTNETPRQQQARRRFLRSLILGGAVVGAAGLGFVPLSQAAPRLRPPGSLAEKDFLAACIKCGQCVQVCPVRAIELADLNEGFGIGVPFIDARAQACDFSCDAVQCVLACPTGALSHDIDKKEQVYMGIARIVRPDTCLARHQQGFKGQARGAAFRGLLRYAEIDRWNPIPVADHPYDLELCDLCVRECPIEGAITLQPLPNGGAIPLVHKSCVGCGVCEMICPVEPAVIEIKPQRVEFMHPHFADLPS